MTHSRTKRTLFFIGNVIIGANLALLGLVSYWLLQAPVTSEVNQPVKILNENKEIAIGENIQLNIEIKKPSNTNPLDNTTVTITCDDGNLVTLASQTNDLPSGEFVLINDRYILPPKALEGTRCVFNFRNTYKVNPIKTVTRDWVSEEFLVLPRNNRN